MAPRPAPSGVGFVASGGGKLAEAVNDVPLCTRQRQRLRFESKYRRSARMCTDESGGPQLQDGSTNGAGGEGEVSGPSWLRGFTERRASMGIALRSYGLAAVISYGLFDACTYGISLLLAMRTFLAAGKAITAKTLPQVLAIIWGINNFSRPFRIAGALALAPIIDAKGRSRVRGIGRTTQ
jgi:hypothetical protein